MTEPQILKYPDPHQGSFTVENGLYWAVRAGIVLAGLALIGITLSSNFVTPALLYDVPPGPPPMRERLPRIILGVAIGMLLCTPHRWTVRGVLFWSRLAVYVALAGFILLRAGQGIVAWLAGGKSPVIVPVSVVLASVAVALPLCLLWSRRIYRRQQLQTA